MKFALLASLLFLPYAALGATSVPAGFAPGSLWLSKSDLVAGDTATLYTVAYNSSTDAVAGDVVFSDASTTLGTKHFSLAAGTTQIVSLPWTATEGAHTFMARMENVNAGSVSLPAAASEELAVSVAPPPPPSPAAVAASSAAGAASSALSSAPAVLASAQGVLGTVDSLRSAAASAIEKTLAIQNPASTTALALSATASGEVLGTSTAKVATSSSDDGWKSLVHASSLGDYFTNAWRALLGAILFILKSDLLFWLSLLIIAYILYRLVRLTFRERRNRKE